ncbi:MAG TPA: hypothetical protein VGP13_00955 [Candidatus Paceibacterota bacterium]|jgi:hypothetical protein|nr:hypothetical protein [Candidatus Paceibacterota bacterium]
MDNLQDTILQKIRDGKLTMRPRFYFTLKAAALVLVALGVLVVSIFLCNFIFFIIRINGHESLLARPGGIFLFLRFFPWGLLVIDAALIVLLEVLLKSFRFGYKSPIVYTTIAVLAVVIPLGFAIDRATDINDRVLERADHHGLPPPFGELYEHAHRPLPAEFLPENREDEIIETR